MSKGGTAVLGFAIGLSILCGQGVKAGDVERERRGHINDNGGAPIIHAQCSSGKADCGTGIGNEGWVEHTTVGFYNPTVLCAHTPCVVANDGVDKTTCCTHSTCGNIDGMIGSSAVDCTTVAGFVAKTSVSTVQCNTSPCVLTTASSPDVAICCSHATCGDKDGYTGGAVDCTAVSGQMAKPGVSATNCAATPCVVTAIADADVATCCQPVPSVPPPPPIVLPDHFFNTVLTEAAEAGATRIVTSSISGFSVGDTITLAKNTPTAEVNLITEFGSMILAYPLLYYHPVGTIVEIGGTLPPTTSATTTSTAGPASTASTAAPVATAAPLTLAPVTTSGDHAHEHSHSHHRACVRRLARRLL